MWAAGVSRRFGEGPLTTHFSPSPVGLGLSRSSWKPRMTAHPDWGTTDHIQSQMEHRDSAQGALVTARAAVRRTRLLGPATMALSLLWLGLTLLGALQTQAQGTIPNWIPAPPLSKVPLQPNFQADQFQGKWYVVGLAGNAVKKEEQGRFKMYTTTYELKEDGSYNVISTLLRGQLCDNWIRTFVPSLQPGQFKLGDIKKYSGLQSYVVRVVSTNYSQFAIVFFKKVSNNQEYFKTTLYGRTKVLSPELKENFVRFAKSLGLSDDNIIFPVAIEYAAINSMLDQINSCLDHLEEKNDHLHARLQELLESNRQTRLEFQQQLGEAPSDASP
uniref:Lipocalin/cytosolic fatty-acid binding domain-containing protein n=1 Tax=Sus scrofa TaxID=9823 RepID=A0A4X1U4R3_PIG